MNEKFKKKHFSLKNDTKYRKRQLLIQMITANVYTQN